MKKLVLVALIVGLLAVPVFAAETDQGLYRTPNPGLTNWLNSNNIYHTHGYTDNDTFTDVRTVLGAKFDAPNLVRFTKNVTLGVEGGKDFYNDPFRDSRTWIEDDKGYFGYVKITYSGTLINFAK